MDPETNEELERIRGNLVRLSVGRGSEKSTPGSEPQYVPTEEEIRERKRLRLTKAGVPARFREAERASIDPAVWNQCAGLLSGESLGLFLHGPVGSGKTHLAVAVLRESARPGCFLSSAELMLRLRESFRDGARMTEGEVISVYSEAGLLVLDDLGAEKPSEFAIQSLYLIVDRRYSGLLPVIITSNFTVGEIAERVGDRIASRIAGMCKVIELQGEDRRLG